MIPDGRKYWRLAYRYNGKQKTLALGVYPEISLKDAREKKLEARKTLAEGKDPQLEKKRQKVMAAQNSTNTFEAIAREWHENNKSKWSENYAKGIIKRLEDYIFDEIGNYQGRMTGHGFRALAMSTIKQELNYRHEVVDRQLAHAPRNKIDAAYDRALFTSERTKMMQEYADFIDNIAAGGQVIKGRFGNE